MERMNVGLKRSQDELPGHKDLLLVILQLTQGNPSILLKVSHCAEQRSCQIYVTTVLSGTNKPLISAVISCLALGKRDDVKRKAILACWQKFRL